VCVISTEDLKCVSLLVPFMLSGNGNNSAVVPVFKDLCVAQEYPIVLFLGVAAASCGRRTKLSLMSLL
jgi:hypothetical protein